MPKQSSSNQQPEAESDEAVLPTRGALRPDRSRDGTAEGEELADVSRRAVEGGGDSAEPLDFEHPNAKVGEARDLAREPEAGERTSMAAEVADDEDDEDDDDVEDLSGEALEDAGDLDYDPDAEDGKG